MKKQILLQSDTDTYSEDEVEEKTRGGGNRTTTIINSGATTTKTITSLAEGCVTLVWEQQCCP